MNYSDLSDFEINKLVAECRGGFGGSANNEYAPNQVICFDERPFYTERDFCGNPSDAWPIIVRNEIGVIAPLAGMWGARDSHDKLSFWDKNPLRAAMIVYLMMKESENEV